MALSKNITMPNGVTATYWKIVRIQNFNLITKKLEILVRGYLNKAARDNNVNESVAFASFDIAIEDATSNILEQCYQEISKTGAPKSGNIDLSGATEV